MAILFKKNIEYKNEETKLDTGGNYVDIKLKMIDTDVTIIRLYGPNIDNPNFYSEISSLICPSETKGR